MVTVVGSKGRMQAEMGCCSGLGQRQARRVLVLVVSHPRELKAGLMISRPSFVILSHNETEIGTVDKGSRGLKRQVAQEKK